MKLKNILKEFTEYGFDVMDMYSGATKNAPKVISAFLKVNILAPTLLIEPFV